MSNAAMKSVLVTGATGEVARGTLPLLAPHFTLRLFAPDLEESDNQKRGNVLDWHSLSEAMQGIDAVLHLAIASGHSGTFEDDAFNDARFDVNVKGTYHVLETARRANVRRIVQVSSLMVVWGYPQDQMVSGDAPPRPVGTYALTKMLSEEVASYYAEQHGLEVITLRIAAPLDVSSPERLQQGVRPQQVPFPDLAQALHQALTVPISGHQTITIVGESSRRTWDLEPARRVLGYEPTIRLDDLNPRWLDPFDVAP